MHLNLMTMVDDTEMKCRSGYLMPSPAATQALGVLTTDVVSKIRHRESENTTRSKPLQSDMVKFYCNLTYKVYCHGPATACWLSKCQSIIFNQLIGNDQRRLILSKSKRTGFNDWTFGIRFKLIWPLKLGKVIECIDANPCCEWNALERRFK